MSARPGNIQWEKIFAILDDFTGGIELPSVSAIAEKASTAYRVLFSTIISLRTRDEVTLEASDRLFDRAPDLNSLLGLQESEIEKLIYPAAFYRNKAASIKKCAEIIRDEYKGEVPSDKDELLKLPGVGRKTANLTLNLGFGINAICVDTHVHRICNRAGWVETKTPDDTEFALEKILPPEYWIPMNEKLVTYGQKICTPISPKCSICRLIKHCRQNGVVKHR